MIAYTLVGANDYGKSLQFYDDLLAAVGAKRVMDFGNSVLYGFSQGPMFGVCKPYDGGKATYGNGTMIALNVGSTDKVDALYAKAMTLGGKDEGGPGARGDNGFYAAYFRDLDGNKLCAFHMLRS